ncbi:PREDICTED: uncharacterized protein LOC109153696 isoform X2 [Ipomoea nil]|uniref:uncharacterized protein LOC109153696 isoform X2 n=1 Tax=Ipomoea nil TaxID=35883 RepID=UPI000901BD68|nr:PREDICTED: uncharacterized protein LOC109153696 isoform X2 [Ipomoea nil]
MVSLSWCWIMVESIVIPNGFFMKWFYLSFYIHPSFLALLQIFLWITKLYTYLLSFLVFVSKISSFVITKTLSFFNRCFCNNQSPSTIIIPTTYGFKTSLSVVNISAVKIYQEEEEVCHVVLSSCSSNSSTSGYASDGILNDQFWASSCSEEEEEEEDDHVLLSSCGSNSPEMGMRTDQFLVSSPAWSSSAAEEYEFDEIMAAAGVCDLINSPPAAMGDDEETNIDDEYNVGEDDDDDDDDDGHQLYQEVTDPFYNAYLQKMKWFDVLNHDRFFATTMMNEKHIAARRVGKSLEHDLELVYVSQSCLSWEALHHQFTKVEAAHSHMLLFHNSVAERFHKFQIVLERFLEDERCSSSGGTTRHSNYIHSKYSLQTLLLVPQLSGYHNGKMSNEGIKAIEVLKAIEKCITTFWLYVKVDTKKLGWSRPVLEDPRDLDLLHALTKLLRKKEAALKRVEGKRRCWLRRRRAVHMQEEENTELICRKIEMKLIGRVLKLPIISTSHLQWCQHKLSNLEFNKDGSIIRAYNAFLFPS